MIVTNRKITIGMDKSTIDESVVLYRGDYEVEIRFTLDDSKFKFLSGVNVIETDKPSYAQLAILRPDADNIFSDITKCSEGIISFVLTKEMIDQINEVGLYSFHIRLFDYNKTSRVTIPPVEYGIEVREPIASEDRTNYINEAKVGYSIVKASSLDNDITGPTFDSSGNYNKTNWENGDRITDVKLNKIEDAIRTINQNEINDRINLDNKITSNFNILDSIKADSLELDVERKRIDNITKLGSGSTTGDAELIDGRIGVDGIVYSNIGDAIRSQIKTAINEFTALPYTLNESFYINYTNGAQVAHTSKYNTSNYIKLINKAKKIYISNVNYNANDSAGLAFYNVDKKFISGYRYNYDKNIELDVPTEAVYMRFTVTKPFSGKVVVYQDIINTLEYYNSEHDNIENYIIKNTQLEIGVPNSFVNSKGICDAHDQYKVSKPVTVNKNSVLFVKAIGYLTNVAVISEYVNGEYIPLVISKDSVTDIYRYEVEKDMQICICSYNKTDWRLYSIDDIYNIYYKSKFNIQYTIFEGRYIRYTDGKMVGDQYTTHLACSDFIDIETVKNVYLYDLKYKSTDLGGLAFYDNEYNFISSKQYTPCDDLEVNVPENAKYIRFTLYLYNVDVTKIKVNIDEYLNGKLSHLYDYSYNYKYNLSSGYYITYGNGNLTPHDNTDYNSTDYITLLSGVNNLIVSHGYDRVDLSGLAFYDNDKKFISGYQYDGKNKIIVEIPSDAKYVRCTMWGKSNNLYIISNINVIDTISKTNDELSSINDKITEYNFDYCQIFHKIAGIGDSLMSGELAYYDSATGSNKYVDCYNYSWLSNLCKNIGATPVHYSSGGRTVSSWLSGFLDRMKSESPKPSAYYIALGTNDRTYTELGVESDCGTDNTTFYGLYSKIINEVKTFNPNAIIFCCSLYYRPNDAKVKEYCNAIKYMAEKYGCYYIDFINRFGDFYSSSNNPFMSVGHFTAPGYVRVGKEMQILTNEVISNNQTPFKFIGLNHKDI